MYVFGRFRIVRNLVIAVRRLRPVKQAEEITSSLLENADLDNAARMLEQDGFYPGLRLRVEVLAALQQFASTSLCFAEENYELPFHIKDRAAAERKYRCKISVGRLDQALDVCPQVQALASDPVLLAIARNYLGCEPVILGSRMWWSFATEADAAQQMDLGQGFHYDLDGYKALAFFFYLSDVGDSNGPHVCVKASHLRKPLLSLLSLHKGRSEEEIVEWYGKDRQVTLCGRAGFGFAEDIFCFHKGSHPEQGERLILQLRYGIRSYDRRRA